jgi:hypothetical protein
MHLNGSLPVGILASTPGNDMRAAIHVRLRLVNAACVEGREDLVAVGQHAGAQVLFVVFVGTHLMRDFSPV